jgi:hypothetical protein
MLLAREKRYCPVFLDIGLLDVDGRDHGGRLRAVLSFKLASILIGVTRDTKSIARLRYIACCFE